MVGTKGAAEVTNPRSEPPVIPAWEEELYGQVDSGRLFLAWG